MVVWVSGPFDVMSGGIMIMFRRQPVDTNPCLTLWDTLVWTQSLAPEKLSSEKRTENDPPSKAL